MERTLIRPHAVSVLAMSKEALASSLNQAWDEIERLSDQVTSLQGQLDMTHGELIASAGKTPQ